MRLGYVILYVPDVAAALAFYAAAFGLARRFLHESGAYGEMETGGTALAFAAEAMVEGNGLAFRASRAGEPPAAAEVGLLTEDVAAAYARAVAAGAAPCLPPTQKPWGQTVSYVRDLNGFLVEICSPVR
jgi:catechol 2,3-dioxygenase-like lactoylglutathione lyase family enzyme